MFPGFVQLIFLMQKLNKILIGNIIIIGSPLVDIVLPICNQVFFTVCIPLERRGWENILISRTLQKGFYQNLFQLKKDM